MSWWQQVAKMVSKAIKDAAQKARPKDMRTLLAVRGLEHTTEAFRRKLIRIADRRGLNPSFLAAVIAFETGRFPFSPSAKNPFSGATGLIQFMKPTANHLGTTQEKLAQMTAVEQLDYGEAY